MPSSTSPPYVPAISAVPKDDAALSFNPQQAWDSTPVTAGTCGSSDVLRSASALNATVSFSYSGLYEPPNHANIEFTTLQDLVFS